MKYIVIRKSVNKVVYFGPYITIREATLFIQANLHSDYEYEISEIYKTKELTRGQLSTIISDEEGTSENNKIT
jgi:hypothetical protein